MGSTDTDRSGDGWAQLRVEVAEGQGEVVADLLWAAGASAIEERADPAAGTLVLLSDAPPEVARGLLPPGASLEVIELDPAWRDAWRAHASSTRVDDGFVVHLVGAERIDRPGDVVVEVEPGHAFGTGSHPTTLQCLRAMRAGGGASPAGRRVLDVGCGSGTLAVAAAVLGATGVTATDVDPEAVRSTAANAVANGVGHLVSATGAPLASLPAGGHDLVLANIGSRVLRELAPELDRSAAPGARLVLAGLLDQQLGDVVAAFAGWCVEHVAHDDGWASPTLARAAEEVR